jgi:predicted alpha/beta hydrolase family esterase
VLPDEVLDIVSDFVKRGREGNELREEEEVPARRLPRRMMLVSSEEDECAFSRTDRRLVRAWGSMAVVGVVIGKVGMTRQDLM